MSTAKQLLVWAEVVTGKNCSAAAPRRKLGVTAPSPHCRLVLSKTFIYQAEMNHNNPVGYKHNCSLGDWLDVGEYDLFKGNLNSSSSDFLYQKNQSRSAEQARS